MKKLSIFIALLAFFFSTQSFAQNTNTLQGVFTPNATTAVFLNCLNEDKNVIQKYEALKKEMAKIWTEKENPDTNIFFITNSPFTRQIIYVYVGGIKKRDGGLCPLPNSSYIASCYRNKTTRSLVNINNPQKTIAEIKKIIK